MSENIAVALSNTKLLTYDDYVALTPPDSGNYELHNGKLIYMASPTPDHQDVVTELCARMRLFASSRKLGKVFAAPLDVVFTPTDILQPDILFIATEHLYIIGDKKIEGAPDLVVEVLSDSNKPREQRYKKEIYETHGVREYWMINPEKDSVTIFVNTNGELVAAGVFKKNDIVSSEILPGFSIRVSEILNT
ncbi:MAG: Uma2 family endonuclease [Saprospiraceae bacterium]|jgi:Uma2 family endonuclease|nr:Uma2 family endonuclease [Saprospiraceae bacterium]